MRVYCTWVELSAASLMIWRARSVSEALSQSKNTRYERDGAGAGAATGNGAAGGGGGAAPAGSTTRGRVDGKYRIVGTSSRQCHNPVLSRERQTRHRIDVVCAAHNA